MVTLTTKRLLIRSPLETDGTVIQQFEEKNAASWQPFVSFVKLTSEEWTEKLQEFIAEERLNRARRFLIFDGSASEHLIGVCNFTQIFRGGFQACYLGYKLDKDYEGKGLMFEALGVTIAYLFEAENLHRIMANYMPANKRSASLLARLGFIVEGQAKAYLQVNGKWEDHVMTALTNSHWKRPVEASIS